MEFARRTSTGDPDGSLMDKQEILIYLGALFVIVAALLLILKVLGVF